MNSPDNTGNIEAIADFASTALERSYPEDVVDDAVKCFIDWFGVSLGAHREETAECVRRTAAALWPGSGYSHVLLGTPSTAGASALINGTLAHCLDYDDTHIHSVAHLSGATIATALAIGTQINATETEILRAFICGFEVGARLGLEEFGSALNHRGWHATGILACLAATVSAAILSKLDKAGMRRALGAAATQVSGLTASFGTMSKPFHAGKAALNAVIAVELAKSGFDPAEDLLEPGAGLAVTLVQDKRADLPLLNLNFESEWEITRNTFKPYASCLLTHPVIDAARYLSKNCKSRSIKLITLFVNPMLPKVAGKPLPQTPLEGKFSAAFCTALGLRGYHATFEDFNNRNIEDKLLQEISSKVRLSVKDDMPKTAARILIEFDDGSHMERTTELALGNPGNPMSMTDIENKFMGLVEPVLGKRTKTLFGCLANFNTPGSLKTVIALTGGTQ